LVHLHRYLLPRTEFGHFRWRFPRACSLLLAAGATLAFLGLLLEVDLCSISIIPAAHLPPLSMISSQQWLPHTVNAEAHLSNFSFFSQRRWLHRLHGAPREGPSQHGMDGPCTVGAQVRHIVLSLHAAVAQSSFEFRHLPSSGQVAMTRGHWTTLMRSCVCVRRSHQSRSCVRSALIRRSVAFRIHRSRRPFAIGDRQTAGWQARPQWTGPISMSSASACSAAYSIDVQARFLEATRRPFLLCLGKAGTKSSPMRGPFELLPSFPRICLCEHPSQFPADGPPVRRPVQCTTGALSRAPRFTDQTLDWG
jgi:hypothetical protein